MNRLSEIYKAMTDLGYEEGNFNEWKKRVQLFYATPKGGIIFIQDPDVPERWWLDAYCPNERPGDNTVKFIMGICFAAGCKEIRSEVKRAGSSKMLERLGLAEIEEGLYVVRAG